MTNLTDRVVHVTLWGLARGLLLWSLVPALWLLWLWFEEQPSNAQVHYLRVAAIGFALLQVAKDWFAFPRRQERRLSAPRVAMAKVRPQPVAVDEKLARHEAAHAVVWAALGGTIITITMSPSEGDVAARVSAALPQDLTHEDSCWIMLVGWVAGNVADLHGGFHEPGSRSDYENILTAVAALISVGKRPVGFTGNLTMDDLINGARDQAAALLEQHATNVDALAQTLQRGGTFLGDDVRTHLPAAAPMPSATPRDTSAAPVQLREPYVGDGADGARRSAQIDLEEADGLDPGERRDHCLASAERWLEQATHLDATSSREGAPS